MPLTEQQQSVFDTLHYRDPHVDGTCIDQNEPGLRLISGGPSFLPAIQAALAEAASAQDWRHLPGLDHVIGAFLVTATKYAPGSLVPFIRSFPRPFMEEILSMIPAVFQRTTDGYNFDVAPAKELLVFLHELEREGDPALQAVVRRVLRFVEPGP